MKRIFAILLVCALLSINVSGYASDETLLSVLDEDTQAFLTRYTDGAAVCMSVLFDQRFPEAIVTDPETMRLMVEALRKARVTAKANSAPPDAYQCVAFFCAEGKTYFIAFEDQALCAGGERYLLDSDAALWQLMKDLSDDWEREREQTGVQGGLPIFTFLDDPEVAAFAENFYDDPPSSVSFVYHWYAASERTATDAETIASAFEALGRIRVGARTDAFADDSDTYLVFRYDDGRSFTFWFNYGNLCVRSDEHPFVKSYEIWGGSELSQLSRSLNWK